MNNKVNLDSNAQYAPSEHFSTKANEADLNLGATGGAQISPSAPPTYNHTIQDGRTRQDSLIDSDSDTEDSHLSRGFRKRFSDRKTIKQLKDALEVETQSNLRKLEREVILKQKTADLEKKLLTIQEENEEGKKRYEEQISEARNKNIFNSRDTVLRDIKKGACPLEVPKSVDISVRQINDIIKLKTALPALGSKFDYDPKKPDTTKFLNFLHTLNDKMSTVPMSGPHAFKNPVLPLGAAF